jgi:uncharacterized protein (DUF2236 family)
MSVAESARTRLATALLGRVAGDDHRDKHDRIHFTPGDRWFEPGSEIQRVHGDASMFVGGLRALLLQSLHPQAMAAVAGHSGYRGDPWGRLQRTSTFLAVTTFGTAEDAERVVGHVREVHERVRGKDEDGVPYRASDPHLLGWVHVAEVDSFLRAHQLYGEAPLDAAGCDAYVAQAAVVARKLGGIDPPTDVASLERALAGYRHELRGTQAARDAARFLLVHPPLPLPARMPYGALAGAGVAMLPRWTRRPLGLPYAPPVEATVVRASGHAMVRAIRWALADF